MRSRATRLCALVQVGRDIRRFCQYGRCNNNNHNINFTIFIINHHHNIIIDIIIIINNNNNNNNTNNNNNLKNLRAHRLLGRFTERGGVCAQLRRRNGGERA